MAAQNVKNHVRWYAPHHFVFYPVLMICIYWAVQCMKTHPDQHELWIAVIIVFFLIGWLSFMLRQHYALSNQNRIVRLELRFRYYVLTNRRLDLLESKLTFKQLAALRFCSDAELPAMVDRAVAEKLAARDIKASIGDWNPDYMRV